jgi:hypothetical protein
LPFVAWVPVPSLKSTVENGKFDVAEGPVVEFEPLHALTPNANTNRQAINFNFILLV